MHRFIPILAKNEGYNKIGEHVVTTSVKENMVKVNLEMKGS